MAQSRPSHICAHCTFANQRSARYCRMCRSALYRNNRQAERPQPQPNFRVRVSSSSAPRARPRNALPNPNGSDYTLDIALFIDDDAKQFTCAICKNILKNPVSIDCRQEHMFCKSCLIQFFRTLRDQYTAQCPQCREYVQDPEFYGGEYKCSKYVQRIIRGLQVKCRLDYLECQRIPRDCHVRCEWVGELRLMDRHVVNDCPLSHTVCSYCGYGPIRRHEAQQHEGKCPRKPILCPLKCNMNVERFLVNDHVTFHCPHTTTRCDHCGEEIFRKDLNNHGCNEVPCPYAKYGCDTRVLKRDLPGEMQQHLATDEVNHLRMKVAFLEDVMKQCPDCMAQVRHMEHERNRESDEFVEEHKEIEVSERVYQRQARYPPPPNPPT
eukprot:3455_1